MSNPVLLAQGVEKAYGRKPVLRGVDLNIPAGTVLGLLGSNGAGKTTLLRCALGLLKIDRGQLALVNEPSSHLSAAAKAQVGYAPQVPALPSWMTVRQVLNYTAAFYPRWNDSLIETLLKDWKVPPDSQLARLSQGEVQKVSILSAIGHEPSLLILDEPAVGLDPSARRRFLTMVLQIVAQGERTVLLSSHLTSDLERVADRLAVLKDGRIWFEGNADTLKEQVVRFHLSSSKRLPTDLRLPGTLRIEVSEQEAVGAARWTPEELNALTSTYGNALKVHSLNLEEIFMEVHHG